MKRTQKDEVVEKLLTDGHVSNFWAIEHYILRLGAIICTLKKEGWSFDCSFGEGKEQKNYYYHVKKHPERNLFAQ